MNSSQNLSQANLVKKVHLDPYIVTDSRIEWKLPSNAVYLSSFRMANLGYETSSTDTQAIGYVRNLGVYSRIANIYLQQGNNVISQLRDVSQWAGFKSLDTTNENNMDKNTYLLKKNMGWTFSSDNKIQFSNNPPNSTITSSDSNSSVFAVSNLVPYLANAGFINSHEVPDLKLVIDVQTPLIIWTPQNPTQATRGATTTIDFTNPAGLGFKEGQEVDFANFNGNGWNALNDVENATITAVNAGNIVVNVDTSGYAGANPTTLGVVNVSNSHPETISALKPYLIIDELIDPNMNNYKTKPVVFNDIVSENIGVGANEMSVERRLNAFNGKTLGRLLIRNDPSAVLDNGFAGSVNMYKERFQFNVNSQQLIPNNGIDSVHLKNAYLQNSFGNLNCPQGSADVRNIQNRENLYYTGGQSGNKNMDLAGNISYLGVNVNQKIIDPFILQYSRQEYPDEAGGGDNDVNESSIMAMDLVVMGEVVKVASVQNGLVEVSA